MKKFTALSLFLLGLMFNLQAQVDYYSLGQYDNTFFPAPSASATTLWTTGDEEEQTGVPIGFDFYYGGKKFTTCTVGVNGAISLTQAQISYNNDLTSTANNKKNIIAPLWDDLRLFPGNNGYVKYETIGSAPNRIFKVFWKNISHYSDSSHTMSFVLYLVESSNVIKFFYGHCDAGATLSASVGFNFYDGYNTTFISVTPDGSGNNPTSSRSTANNNINSSLFPIQDHLTFTFQRPYNDLNSQPRRIILADPRAGSYVTNYMNNIGATDSGAPTPNCASFNGGDVWYKFVTPPTGAISIIRTAVGDIGAIGYAIYHNSVNSTPIFCNSILDSNINIPNMIGNLAPNETYFIRMWDYNNNDFGITPFYVAKVEPNDEAAYAKNINVQPENATSYTMSIADNTLAMGSYFNGSPACGSYQGGDVWFKFTAPGTGKVNVHHSTNAGDWSSFVFAVYSDPDSTSAMDCQVIYITAGSPPYDVKEVTGLTAGQEYWLRTWDFNNDNVGTSSFYLTDDVAGIEDYQQLAFKFYPNPATDVLNVNAASNIDMISITNLLGQEVRHVTPNQKQVVLNVADLQNGVYLMKVQTEDKASTVKFIKK